MAAVPSSHAQRVLSALNQQRGLGRFCDAMLSLGSGQVYLAHRNVLACFSGLFQESYTTTTPCMEVCLPEDCPTDGLELLLDFVYTGELKLDSVNVEKVQSAAVSLSVPEALNLCQNFTCQPTPSTGPKVEELTTGDESCTSLDTSLALQDTSSADTPAKGKPKPRSAPKPRAKATSATPQQTAPVTPTTTTRSGRTVKGPSRLLRESPTPPLAPRGSASRRPDPGGPEDRKGAAEEGGPSSDQPVSEAVACETTELVNENEEEDAAEAEGPQEDTDEEYLPHSVPTSTTGPQRGKRKGRGKAVNKENGEGTGRDPKRNSVQCPTCHKTFLSKYYLKVHNRRHTGEKPFECSKCGKCYYRKENLMEHEARNCLNRAGVVFSCSMCPMTFRRRLELRFHTVTHTGEMPNKCSLCPKCFLSRTELRLHEASKHRGEKLFVCEECGHRASSRNGLQMHIKAIHRQWDGKKTLVMASFQRFTEKGPLLRHVASKHQEGRPHYCHICSKTFKAIEQLRVHVRRHKGMRKFECMECGYKFTRQAHLRRHSQIHNRVENYNPRQRRLRNLVVEDEKAALPALPAAGDIISVMIQPGAIMVEEVVSTQAAAPPPEEEEGPGFTVADVMEQTLLVTGAYPIQTAMATEEMPEGGAEEKA
ncbi:hypothetical protein JZ751_023942 [Albula glossodonta]|uniref:Zinc finger and BTB domain containing 48 n=1 Tax=Albula glossodonta TaxID=121402 RepID=A0A8T2NHP9_9TELE|nr:hypothetical protein JZ751_023942 [Albula glossodonta]